MAKTVLQDGDDGVSLVIRNGPKRKKEKPSSRERKESRVPVHVVYGGADRFTSGTARKLGDIALHTLGELAPDERAFTDLFDLPPEAASIFERVEAKLSAEPIEDFRIDFEDGYGHRPDVEEDADAERSAAELASTVLAGTATHFSGIRIKGYGSETRDRATRTLNVFLTAIAERSNGELPPNFVVTLPKVTDARQVRHLCRDIRKSERRTRIKDGSIKIELMIEHPRAVVDKKGMVALASLVNAAGGRCVAAHFGAYDYTAALGIAASEHTIDHPACHFARQLMLISLGPLNVRLSDSVTTQLPVPLHRGPTVSKSQKAENASAMKAALRAHFQNVRRSMAHGFYQSWDLHPNQLIARYAAVYSFFSEARQGQAERLASFIQRATRATLTGHTFDDAATAMSIVNFFRMGIESGALDPAEVERDTGLAASSFRLSSFPKILESLSKSR